MTRDFLHDRSLQNVFSRPLILYSVPYRCRAAPISATVRVDRPRPAMPQYILMRPATILSEKKLGHKTVVVLPVHYPRELFTAMDVHTVELWGPPGPARGPDAGRIQEYACAVVRNALAFLASGGADAADAVLFPHTCDSIQGLATLAPDFGGWGKPALRYLHPKGEAGPAAPAVLPAQLA